MTLQRRRMRIDAHKSIQINGPLLIHFGSLYVKFYTERSAHFLALKYQPVISAQIKLFSIVLMVTQAE